MQEVESVIKDYLSGSSIRKLAQTNNISEYRIRKILTSNNIHIRSRNEQNKYSPQNQRKYQINDNFFDVIDCPDKAYLLGFYAADGCVNKNGTISLALSSRDKGFLERVRNILSSDYPIKDYKIKEKYEVSRFSFRSEKIKEEFKKYNITENKTYTYSFPTNLDKRYVIDFIRGYWDGDGTVCLSGNYPRTSLCGHQLEVLEYILDFLEREYNIPKVNIYKDKNDVYYFQYSMKSSEKLYNAFYSNLSSDSLFLVRKYNKFKELFGVLPSHEPATSHAEDKIV